MLDSMVFFAILMATCGFLPISTAIDCKEVFERKDEIKDCCSAPVYLNTDGLDKCFDEHKDKEKREMFTCAFECFFRQQQVLDENGDVSKEKMLAKVEGFEGEWKQASTTAIEECFAKQEKLKAKFGEKRGDGGCNPSSGFMNMCLGRKFIESCPAEHWNDSDLCNKVKSAECEPKKGKDGQE